MRKKLLGFMYGRLDIFVCIAIFFQLSIAVTPSSQYLYAENSTVTVKVLVIAGGGAGAVSTSTGRTGGGGGAGGYIYNAAFEVTAQEYPVTVGQGATSQDNGENSVFGSIIATGGGRGGEQEAGKRDGISGGSGGGGCGSIDSSYVGSGGAASPAGQGSAGGNGSSSGQGYGAGGGGGAGGVGGNGSWSSGGNGGIGIPNSISGSSVYYAGGGGGWSSPNMGSGGLGGGGNAGTPGTAGTPNTGGGGGGGTAAGVGSGGSGIVIIRYVTADFGECTGGTITTDGADTIHTFTESGTFTVALRTTSPTVTTGSATGITSSSATLNGTVNANGLSTSAWFNYGIAIGSYTGTTTTQSVSGSSDTSVNIGISGLLPSTMYYYRITAQSSEGTSYGSETSFTTLDITPPTVSSTNPASNATGVAIRSTISATFSEDMNSSTINTSTFTLSSSSGSNISGTVSYSNKVATFTPSSNLSYLTTYTAAITTGVKDTVGNAMLSYYLWSFTTASSNEPSGSVSINSGALYTNSTVVTLTLTAKDDVGVVGYYVSTSSSTPIASASGWNSVTSATSYTGSVSYTLASGDENKTVYVWYKDAAGNVSSTASASITLDATAPIVTITSPTSDPSYTVTSNTIAMGLGGSASDSTSGVSSVTWSNSRGGSGAASGTTSWSISSPASTPAPISLASGDNTITVIATDKAGNTGKDTITVTVIPPTPEPSPTPTTTPRPSPTPTPTIPGIIVGIVADSVSGVGIAEAKITSEKGGYSATTRVDGSYTIFEVSTGSYTLTATAEGYASSSQPVTVYADEITVVDFLLTPGGIVFGTVQNEDEDTLGGVTVIIEGNNFSDNTETDEAGFFTFENISSGDYTLTFEKEEYKTQTMGITLGEGEFKDVGIITLEPVETAKIYGYVMNIRGNPLEFARLKLKGIKTKVIKTASSDAEGFFEFTDLETDTYIIFAKKKRYRNTQRKVNLGNNESEEVEIVMKKTSKRIKGLIEEDQ